VLGHGAEDSKEIAGGDAGARRRGSVISRGMTTPWILYGANGYTGELIAAQAAAEGLRPLLAGRNAEALARVGGRLGLEWRAFDLKDPDALARQLGGAPLVLHAAGPFSATSEPMVSACLKAGAHYLDITGEIEVFEACKRRDAEARAREVVVMPGVGFDVVPSDCLARAVAEALPGAIRLEMAFQALGSISRGTMKTMIEHLGEGVLVRRGGRLETVEAGSLGRTVEFAGKPRRAVAISWGDVSTAYHSTGIDDITVMMALPPKQARGLKWMKLLGPLLRRRLIIKGLQAIVDRTVTGPGEALREQGQAHLWAQVTAADGRTLVGRLRTPEGYKTTVITALTCVRKVLAGEARAGYQTPSSAFGVDLIRGLPGFALEIGPVQPG
jgi:short subunit dehydrogenase-like uncharacterized protein